MQNSISFCRNIYISGTFTTLKSVRKINIVTILIIFLLPLKKITVTKLLCQQRNNQKELKFCTKCTKCFTVIMMFRGGWSFSFDCSYSYQLCSKLKGNLVMLLLLLAQVLSTLLQPYHFPMETLLYNNNNKLLLFLL